MAKNKTKRFPSQIRYDETNPVVSFRLTKEEHDKVKAIADDQGCTVSYLFKDAMGLIEEREGWAKKGRMQGNEEATRMWRIWGYCVKCGKEMYVRPNSSVHEKIIEFLKESHWGHANCDDEPIM